MKNSLEHLPKLKQDEINLLSKTIEENCSDIEKVILFGSYARGNYKEEKDLKPNRKSGHISDYDILAITTKKEVALDSILWKNISEKCKNLNLSASPRIITHDIEALNIKLAEGQYFYSDIKKEGVIILGKNVFDLADERELTLKEQQRIAQEHFDYWFGRANNFLDSYELMLSKFQYTDAAFHLHQVAESSYKTVLLVFSNKSPNEHFLAFLGEKSEQYSDLLKNIFSKISKEDEERFRLLEYAYIGGRYDPEYKISEEDLEMLAIDVKKLLILTKEICEKRIAKFLN